LHVAEQDAIKVEGLSKSYGFSANDILSATQLRKLLKLLGGKGERNILALDNVTFNVKPGEVFGLLGPNGAGKTTLIKILSTLLLPDSGKAYVYGVDVVERPRKVVQLLQTVLSESLGFERRLTARQNLQFYATLYGLSKREASERIDDLLEFCGLMDRADTMFQKFSTGMARRLLVCRALLTDAKVLLFDEPTSGLDPISAASFRSLMKDVLIKKGRTILLATHNLWEAQHMCDRIAVLQKGKILAVDSPTKIRNTVAEVVHLIIRLQGDDSGFIKVINEHIKDISGVLNYEIRYSDQSTELRIDCERDVDYNEIFSLLNSAKAKINYLEASQPSLEEAFLKLTSGK
jgi:ABC-2 type transport system ATP-binding protein